MDWPPQSVKKALEGWSGLVSATFGSWESPDLAEELCFRHHCCSPHLHLYPGSEGRCPDSTAATTGAPHRERFRAQKLEVDHHFSLAVSGPLYVG